MGHCLGSFNRRTIPPVLSETEGYPALAIKLHWRIYTYFFSLKKAIVSKYHIMTVKSINIMLIFFSLLTKQNLFCSTLSYILLKANLEVEPEHT